MINIESKLQEKGKSGRLAIGEKDYLQREKNLIPDLEVITEMEDDLIEADPYSVSSVVARLVKDNPKSAELLKKAQKDTQEVFLGLRPLSQSDLDKLGERGVDMKEFITSRERAFQKKVRRHYILHLEGLVVRTASKKAFKSAASQKEGEIQEDDEIATLARRRRKGKKAGKWTKTPARVGRAIDQPLSSDSLFD